MLSSKIAVLATNQLHPKKTKKTKIMFTRELRRRLAAAGGDDGGAQVVALAVHPGNVLTDVVRTLPAWMQRAYRALMAALLLTPDQGAAFSFVFVCVCFFCLCFFVTVVCALVCVCVCVQAHRAHRRHHPQRTAARESIAPPPPPL